MDIKELEKQVEMLLDMAYEAREKWGKKETELLFQGDDVMATHEATLLNGMWGGRCHALEDVLKLIRGEDLV